MKTKVLLISLTGLLILFTITSKAYSACGYYYYWYLSCETTECDPNDTYWVWGSETNECRCMEDGAWETCWTEESNDPSDICTILGKIGDDCGDIDYVSSSYIDICKSAE